METKKKEHPEIKSKLHPRNKHRKRYNLKRLCKAHPELSSFVIVNDYGDETVNFFDPEAVKALNIALLKSYYSIQEWDVPKGYLCPPIPGRADYIHYIADLLASVNGSIPKGEHIKCLDTGVGANCIYPIIGNREYHWSFIGSEVDETALDSAQKIVDSNQKLIVDLRLQKNPKDTFRGVLYEGERIDVSICNPPFHKSAEEALAGSRRKVSNLKKQKVEKPVLNFSGQSNELWCKGGEEQFIRDMIYQSRQFSKRCFWFTTLVAKKVHLHSIYKLLNKVGATEVKTIPMGQGNKASRMVAWTFLSSLEQKDWKKRYWQA